MAAIKISGLPFPFALNVGTPNGTEVFPADQVVGGVRNTVSITSTALFGPIAINYATQQTTIGSPSSGTALTVKGIAAGAGTVIVSDSVALPSLSNFVIAASTYTLGQWGIGMDASDVFSISRLDVAHTALQISLAGCVTLPIPASGTNPTLTLTGAVGAEAAVFNGGANGDALELFGSATSGQSFGLFVGAGTTAGDYCVKFQPKSGGTNFLQLRGDGSGTIGASTANLGWSWDSGGHWNLGAPASGSAAAIQGVSGAVAVTLNTTSGNAGILNNGTLAPALSMNSAGADCGQIGNGGTQIWYLGHGNNPGATGTAVLTWNASGQVVISAPSVGAVTAFSVSGVPGGFVEVLNGSTSSGNSFGLLVSAGTTAADTCAQFNNATNTIDFLRIFGNGQIGFGDGTVSAAIDYGGVLQFGTISSHVISFFTANANWWDIATDGGFIRHGITGGSQGAGTINANGLFISANQIFFGVPASASTTIARTDVGKTVVATGTITVPNAVFSQGDAVSIYNNSGAAITISAGITTMRLSGTATTGSRTLAQRGMATLWFNSGTEVVVMGAGVT